MGVSIYPADHAPSGFPNITAEIIQLLQEPWAQQVSADPFEDERWTFCSNRSSFFSFFLKKIVEGERGRESIQEEKI